MSQIPVDLASSPLLKFMKFEFNDLHSISDEICALGQLDILSISYEPITSIPRCVGTMNSLEAIWLDVCPQLREIPLTMFHLPHLRELSVFNGNIDFQSLVEYNVPEAVRNGTEAVEEWFDANFIFNSNETEYWLLLQPINDQNTADFPVSLQKFLNLNQTDIAELAASCDFDQFCMPQKGQPVI